MPGSIATWLAELGLAQWTDVFIANDITPDMLPGLSDSDLRDIGISSLGARRRILSAIRASAAPKQTVPSSEPNGTPAGGASASSAPPPTAHSSVRVGTRGDVQTIAAALAALANEGTILLLPGEHECSETLTKNVTIASATTEAVTVFSTTGPVFTVTAGSPTLRNVRIEQRATRTSNTPVDETSDEVLDAVSAVVVTGGNLTMLGCRVRSMEARGVSVRGPAARANIERCVVEDCFRSGLFFSDGAGGEVVATVSTRNKTAGIWVENFSDPVVRDSIFAGCGEGIRVQKNGVGTFERCEARENRFTGVNVQSEAQPTLRKCTFRHSQDGSGILVTSGGWGVFENCDSFGNRYAGIEVSDGGCPVVRDSSFHDSTHGCGIFVHKNGGGVFEDCRSYRNPGSGIEVREFGNPTVSRTTCSGSSSGYGIFIHRSGRGTFDGCTSSENKMGDRHVDESSNPSFIDAAIR